MIRLMAALALLAFVSACGDPVVISGPASTGPAPAAQDVPDELRTSSQTGRAFASVVNRVEPIAERECRSRTTGVNCDFRILIDDRPNQPANAFQTLDENKRPLLIFTIALLNEARNADEIAFVMGHEAAHHIRGHIARQQQNAAAGAILLGGIASVIGGDLGSVEAAQQLGAQVGARSYSKDFELEADVLGTVITARAGYDPVRGAGFFTRIPDPGDRFLGTHPPNAQRIQVVRQTAAGL
ncbi:MAG: M48 family metallopeptidase [Tateyamaria sp.]|uniref:M48 family metallopeptidase n=1 Tax=Tateyamaria sp. TaxID=1929288 RepID=UPI00326C9681